MTDRQIEAARRSLPGGKKWAFWTPEEKKLYEELSCRDMINSCLCYGGISGFWSEHSWCRPDQTYADKYVRSLGLERVKQIVAEQEADFAKATVIRDSYTDSEGCTYNSIIWGDER